MGGAALRGQTGETQTSEVLKTSEVWVLSVKISEFLKNSEI